MPFSDSERHSDSDGATPPVPARRIPIAQSTLDAILAETEETGAYLIAAESHGLPRSTLTEWMADGKFADANGLTDRPEWGPAVNVWQVITRARARWALSQLRRLHGPVSGRTPQAVTWLLSILMPDDFTPRPVVNETSVSVVLALRGAAQAYDLQARAEGRERLALPSGALVEGSGGREGVMGDAVIDLVAVDDGRQQRYGLLDEGVRAEQEWVMGMGAAMGTVDGEQGRLAVDGDEG